MELELGASSWHEKQAIVNAVRAKLNSKNYMLDVILKKDLDNFIRMKQRQESQRSLLSQTLTADGRSQEIANQVTKWLQENAQNLIKSYKPAHEQLHEQRKQL